MVVKLGKLDGCVMYYMGYIIVLASSKQLESNAFELPFANILICLDYRNCNGCRLQYCHIMRIIEKIVIRQTECIYLFYFNFEKGSKVIGKVSE